MTSGRDDCRDTWLGWSQGGSILVVGREGQDALCRRFRGAADQPRHEIVLTAGERTGCRSRLHEATTARDATRSPSLGDRSRLALLAREVVAEIDRLAESSRNPGQVRVCIDAVPELLRRATLDEVVLFLGAVTERTREASGLVHAHVDATYRSGPVRRLEAHVDAIVEVRADPHPRQRWHVPDSDAGTGLLPVSD